nr:MAG TPA: hypothetical protein [Caudoviricetes sp.]
MYYVVTPREHGTRPTEKSTGRTERATAVPQTGTPLTGQVQSRWAKYTGHNSRVSGRNCVVCWHLDN